MQAGLLSLTYTVYANALRFLDSSWRYSSKSCNPPKYQKNGEEKDDDDEDLLIGVGVQATWI